MARLVVGCVCRLAKEFSCLDEAVVFLKQSIAEGETGTGDRTEGVRSPEVQQELGQFDRKEIGK